MNQQEKFEELRKQVNAHPLHSPKQLDFAREAEKLDRAHKHKLWCDCPLCQRIRLKEGSVTYSVRVKSRVKAFLDTLGGEEVARRLEAMVE